MIEPSILSWSVVIFIILTGWLGASSQDFDEDD